MDLRLDCVPQRPRDTDIRGRWRPMAASHQAGRQDEASPRVRTPHQVKGQPRHGRRFHRERSQALEPPQEASQGVRGVHVASCQERRQQRSCQDGEEQWLRVRGHHLRTGPRAGKHREPNAEHPALEPSIRCKLRRHIEAPLGCLGGGCCLDSFLFSGSFARLRRLSFQIPLLRSIFTFLPVTRLQLSSFDSSEALSSAMHYYGAMTVLVRGNGFGIHKSSQRCAFGTSHILLGGDITFVRGGLVRWFTKSCFTLVRVEQYTPSLELDIYTKDFAVIPIITITSCPPALNSSVFTIRLLPCTVTPRSCNHNPSNLTTPEPNLTSATFPHRTAPFTALPRR